MHRDALNGARRVAIIDDLLATGGTAAAAAKLVGLVGGEVVAMLFAIELLDLEARKSLNHFPIEALLSY